MSHGGSRVWTRQRRGYEVFACAFRRGTGPAAHREHARAAGRGSSGLGAWGGQQRRQPEHGKGGKGSSFKQNEAGAGQGAS